MPGTSQFPLAFDTFPVIDANTQEDTPGAEHDVVHANVHAALQALQAKVGVDGSAVSTSLDARMAAIESRGFGYVHTQATAASTWTINHNLGFRPSVELFTTGGVEFDGEVVHTSVNQTVITLASAMAGTARLT